MIVPVVNKVVVTDVKIERFSILECMAVNVTFLKLSHNSHFPQNFFVSFKSFQNWQMLLLLSS